MKCSDLVEKILDANHHIRFAAIFDMSGNIRASGQRKGVKRLLSDEDTGKWAGMAVNAWKNREQLYPKLGRGEYALVVYEKIKRITMPVGNDHLIYVTFDYDGGQEDVIKAVLNQKPGFGVPGLE